MNTDDIVNDMDEDNMVFGGRHGDERREAAAK